MPARQAASPRACSALAYQDPRAALPLPASRVSDCSATAATHRAASLPGARHTQAASARMQALCSVPSWARDPSPLDFAIASQHSGNTAAGTAGSGSAATNVARQCMRTEDVLLAASRRAAFNAPALASPASSKLAAAASAAYTAGASCFLQAAPAPDRAA